MNWLELASISDIDADDCLYRRADCCVYVCMIWDLFVECLDMELFLLLYSLQSASDFESEPRYLSWDYDFDYSIM